MNILHISAECFPIVKVGGLADVVGALPKYQKELGTTSTVAIKLENINTAKTQPITIDKEFTELHLFGN